MLIRIFLSLIKVSGRGQPQIITAKDSVSQTYLFFFTGIWDSFTNNMQIISFLSSSCE